MDSCGPQQSSLDILELTWTLSLLYVKLTIVHGQPERAGEARSADSASDFKKGQKYYLHLEISSERDFCRSTVKSFFHVQSLGRKVFYNKKYLF